MRGKKENITEKLFYKINEVGAITGIKPYVLRYWETEFPDLKPKKDSGDQRLYKQSDIEVILKIKQLLYDDLYTIAGAKNILKKARKKKIVQSIDIDKSLHEIKEKLQDILEKL